MTRHSPIGTPAATAAARRRATDPAYAEAADAVAIFEQLARMIIRHRTEQGLSQEALAGRIGTSHSAISRLESGQHACRPDTLARVADGLGIRFLIGFESGPADNPTRELVTT
jgi:ribosome-binding protein aMBF1 (putative translation factor)